ncbi:hypothetical protein ACLVWU_09125 [Bdellovibrio sp. HCB290]|uniref:hypothetical protein n=1 Tax=Bdellovibrio sp. HCB290 TaxID=3394356 RepID=UPI0039B629E7
MSSISSDRARQDEKLRQTREEYEGRETENSKRRNAEIKRLEQRYHDEVKSITDSYENKIDSLKERNRELLTDKDLDNNRKIDEVRNTYREALRNKTEESYNDRAMLRESYQGQLDKQKQVTEAQKNNLVGQLNTEIKNRDEQLQRSTDENRQKARENVSNNARRLNDAHEKERSAMASSHQQEVASKNRAINEMRKSYDSRIKQSETMRENEKETYQQKISDIITNGKETYSDNLQMKQAVMESELDRVRDKYQNTLERKMETLDSQNEEFRDSVNGRINSQVRSKDSQIQRLNSKLNNEMAKNEKLRGIERKNLTQAYEKQLDIVEHRREDAVERMRDLADERVDKMNQKNAQLLRNVDREYQSQANVTNARNSTDRETMKQQHSDQMIQVNSTAESRVKKITDLSAKNAKRLGEYYGSSLEQMEDNYTQRMDGQRQRFSEDQIASNKAMTERFRGMEQTFNTRLENTVKSYEDKIAQLKDNQDKEIKRLERMFGQRMENQGKASKNEKESVTMQYEAKLAQLSESHQDQLERMNRRHQEDMQNLSVKMSSYSRKA